MTFGVASQNRRVRLALVAMAGCTCALVSCSERESQEPRSSAKHVYEYGAVVRFGLGGESHRFRTTGWSATELDHTWSDGPAASIAISAPAPNAPLRLTMRLSGMTAPPGLPAQPVDVYVQGEKVATWQVAEENDYVAVIPEPLTRRGFMNIDLHIPKAVAPAETMPGADPRRLGIACVEFKIEPVVENSPAAAAP